jgi:hypothetical protein
MTVHFGALAFLFVLATGVFVWVCLKGTGRRAIATGVFTLLTLGAFAAGVESTGQPRPIQLEWRDVSQAEMIGLAWDEDQHVVWVWLREGGAPRAYVLPWPKDQKQFGELQDKWRRRGSTGDEFKYDADGDVARVVKAKPMPPKEAQ